VDDIVSTEYFLKFIRADNNISKYNDHKDSTLSPNPNVSSNINVNHHANVNIIQNSSVNQNMNQSNNVSLNPTNLSSLHTQTSHKNPIPNKSPSTSINVSTTNLSSKDPGRLEDDSIVPPKGLVEK